MWLCFEEYAIMICNEWNRTSSDLILVMIECFSYLNKFIWIWNLVLRSIIVQIEFFLTDAAAIQFWNWGKQKRGREMEIDRVNNPDLNYVLDKVLHAHPLVMLHSIFIFVFFIGLFFFVKYWFVLISNQMWTVNTMWIHGSSAFIIIYYYYCCCKEKSLCVIDSTIVTEWSEVSMKKFSER